MCIVETLLEKPMNPRELSLKFKLDYSTIRHSLRVLEKNRIVYVPEQKYGAKYRTTPEFEGMMDEFKILQEKHECLKT